MGMLNSMIFVMRIEGRYTSPPSLPSISDLQSSHESVTLSHTCFPMRGTYLSPHRPTLPQPPPSPIPQYSTNHRPPRLTHSSPPPNPTLISPPPGSRATQKKACTDPRACTARFLCVGCAGVSRCETCVRAVWGRWGDGRWGGN